MDGEPQRPTQFDPLLCCARSSLGSYVPVTSAGGDLEYYGCLRNGLTVPASLQESTSCSAFMGCLLRKNGSHPGCVEWCKRSTVNCDADLSEFCAVRVHRSEQPNARVCGV